MLIRTMNGTLTHNEKVYALLCVAFGRENSVYTVLVADFKTF
jgi:hypothetical protein